MKHILSLVTATIFISGCSAPPINYSFGNGRPEMPTRFSTPIKGVAIDDISYNPPGNIGQFRISALGCISCERDGSTPSFEFSQPISEIVKKEFKASMSEALLSSSSEICTLNGAVDMIGIHGGDGMAMDATFTVSIKKDIIYKKRILLNKISAYSGILSSFGMLQKVVQRSAEELLAESGFRSTINEKCQTKG